MLKRSSPRQRRCKLIRRKIAEQLNVVRLSVHRTPKHIYAQLVTCDGARVIASASTLDKEVKADDSVKGKINQAALIGKLIAERGIKNGVTKVAFDRSGFRYHGRIEQLAKSAREHGLQF
jgi:large subunit ribosomal protein L18